MTDMDYGLYGLLMVAEVVAILLAYAYVWRPAALAAWRQDLFEVRNRLWDEMRRVGRLDSEAHLELRERVNGLIYSAEYINLWFFLFAPVRRRSAVRPLTDLIAEEPHPEARQALTLAMTKLAGLIATRLCLWTMPGMLVGLPLGAFLLCRRYLSRAMKPVGRLLGLSALPTTLRRWANEAADRIETQSRSRAAEVEHLAHC